MLICKTPSAVSYCCDPPAVELESGSWSRKFDKTASVDGEFCELIKEQIELKGRARHADGQWEDVEFKVSGSSRRSLERYITLETKLEGTSSSNRTLTEGGPAGADEDEWADNNRVENLVRAAFA